jgi:mono/diheme cytochrome c family protein
MRKLLLATLLGAVVAGTLGAAPQQAGKEAPAPANPNKALINRYCVGCHNQRLKTAKLELDVLDLAHPEKNALTWERAIRKLRGGMMPPPGAPRPSLIEVNSLATYLEDSLDKAGAANLNPGSVRIHRLNRAEYANAARDLFGIDVDAGALLPTDDISDGFDNIAGALKVSPSFLDQYIMAARAVTKKAVGTPFTGTEVKATLRGLDAGIPLPPGSRGGVTARYLFPYEGDYELRAPGNPAIFTIDGKIVDSMVDAKGRTHLTAGFHTVVAANPAHSFVESEGELQGFAPGLAGTGYASTGTANSGAGGGRGALGASITINGPFNPAGSPIDTPSRARIFICRPPDAREETACAARILSNIGRKAFRRPVTEKDLAPLMQFYSEGRKIGTFDAGIESALIALLSSSKFLYRIELPPANAKPGSIYQLSGLELASRLSFFLWSSLPDDELLAAGEQGKLLDPKVLAQQVRRMLADPRSKTLTTNFAFEWLKVRDMDKLDPDPYVYPGFDESLRTAFRREMELFVDSVFREDRSVVDLLSANYTFVNERLAAHYGVENIRGDQFRRVTLTDPNRFGLLGKGAVLMVTAYPNRTSPVLRGAYILENLLGTPPSPPPPNVEAFKENKEGEKPKTIREIMETHRANPTCNACHGVMDPLGFSLENFDTVASYRSMDRFTRTKIDTSGKLVDGTAVNGPSDLRKALLTRPEQFAQTFTEKLMMYALGRGIEAYDMPSVRKIVKESKRDSNYKFSSIVMGIVTAPAFQSSMVEPVEPAAPAQVAAK